MDDVEPDDHPVQRPGTILLAATSASWRSAIAVAPVWDCSPSTSMSSFWVYQE